MQSKTSFFNKTVFKKNLTRFAPVWVGYTLILCTFFLMFYFDETSANEYNKLLGFVYSFTSGMVEVFMFWNLAYALLTAQMLFGDLFNNRMCNALHAMPLRREAWFATNCISGLAFSLGPTLIAALLLVPMLSVSIVENAWVLALLWFLSTNLQFICCFGIAAFAAMCVGSRLTMAAGYGLIHFGSYIAYWLVDTVYTPMLYGVITPDTLAGNLSPVAQMMNYRFVKIENMIYGYSMLDAGITLDKLADMTLQFSLSEHWWRIFAIAGMGIVFALLALLLYRKRDVECAGDAVAFPLLKPVFQVLCSLFVMCAGQFVVSNILGMREFAIPIMAICLVVGWFIAKMLIEHSTRVFRLKNWYGLVCLAVCMALTLVATYFDVLNIEGRLPDLNKVETVRFETNRTSAYNIPEEDWEDVLRVHELAVQDRVEEQGLYKIQEDGSRVVYAPFLDRPAMTYDPKENPDIEEQLGYEDFIQAGNIRITYTFKDGSYMMRRYNIWTDGEIGDLTRKTLSSWDILTFGKTEIDGEEVPILDAAIEDFRCIAVTGNSYKEMPRITDKKEIESFLNAVKLDAEAGTMLQDDYFHRGVFSRLVEVDGRYSEETYFDTRECIYAGIEGRAGTWEVRVYPDCVNTMNWIKERNLLIYDVYPDAVILPG